MSDALPPCRCKHAEAAHVWTSVHLPDRTEHTGEHVCFCGCPEYRPAETPDWADLDGPGWKTLWEGRT